jgi:hypothetical protein
MHDDKPSIAIQRTLDDEIRPLARFVADALAEAEAFGRAIVEVFILLPEEAQVYGAQREVPRVLYASRELTVPADDEEVDALAQAWHRELQRGVGIAAHEAEEE